MRPRRALKQWFSAVYIPQSHVEHLLGPLAPELAFLASCQVMLLLRVQGPLCVYVCVCVCVCVCVHVCTYTKASCLTVSL